MSRAVSALVAALRRAREGLARWLGRAGARNGPGYFARRAAGVPSFLHAYASNEAETRAADLLMRVLDPSQRKELEHGYFSVNVPGRGKFWIFAWRSLNVVDPKTGDCYCCTPEMPLPLCDLMLAQKLLLECDPDRFFSVANRQPQFVTHPAGARALILGR